VIVCVRVCVCVSAGVTFEALLICTEKAAYANR